MVSRRALRPAGNRSGQAAWPRPSPLGRAAPGGRPHRPAGVPAAGATCRRSRSAPRFERPATVRRGPLRGGRDGYVADGLVSDRREPHERVARGRRRAHGVRRRRSTATRSTWTPRPAPPRLDPLAALPRPGRRGRDRVPAGADARHRRPGRRRRRAPGRGRAALLWLEAMKMEHTVAAPYDGVVTPSTSRAGQQVDGGRRARRRARRAGMTSFTETEERQRAAQAGRRAGAEVRPRVLHRAARSGGKTTDLWQEAGKLGYLGVNLPEEYGGGGGGIGDLAVVWRSSAAPGCPLLMMVVSPGDLRHRHRPVRHDGAEAALAAGPRRRHREMAFGITEPDAGSNSHRITTTARRDGDDWLLTGRKIFISGVDIADARPHRRRAPRTRAPAGSSPCLFIVPTDAPGFECHADRDGTRRARRSSSSSSSTTCGCPPTRWSATRTPGCCSSSPGSTPSGSWRPRSRIGMGRYALDRAVDVRQTRKVWEAADRRPPGHRPPAGRRPTSSSSWPG